MKEIVLITDGACIGNPGPGGWACLLRYKDCLKEISGAHPATTNNRMELQAVIEGLKTLMEPCAVVIRTDSKYVQDGMTKWIHNWKRNGWVRKAYGRSAPEPIKNRDLWEELDRLRQQHQLNWQWVKGHASDPDNNRCDSLANQAARRNSR
ncbi:MAG: ribonuclease HI [Acidobacteriia bacterium]|nr:ribonuclease HI [Terriglobia bacterium]